jgi:hypothetical protein
MDPPDRISKEASRRLRTRRLALGRQQRPGSDGELAAHGILAADSVGAPGHSLAAWLADRFNQNFDDYDRAIDSVYNLQRTGGSQYHHLLDGQHDVWGAFRAVQDVRADDAFAEELGQALEHIARDTTSVSGVNPFFSLTPDQFDQIGSMAAEIGVSKPFLADALTLNGPELLGGSAALVSAILMGRAPSPDRLSRFSGGCLLSAAAAANPLLLPIAAAGMAYAVVQTEDHRTIFVQSGQGAIVSGTALLVSTLVGGPTWLGCAAGFMAAIAVSGAMAQPAEALENARSLLNSATRVMQQVAPSLRQLAPQHV